MKVDAISGDMEDDCGYPVMMKNTAGAMFLTFPVNDSFLGNMPIHLNYALCF